MRSSNTIVGSFPVCVQLIVISYLSLFVFDLIVSYFVCALSKMPDNAIERLAIDNFFFTRLVT